MIKPLITVVVPSYNQGQYLEETLISIFSQEIALEVLVMDGGSTDNSVEIIKKYEHKLAGWRSHKDAGQSAAINEGVAMGSAPYVCWLNSDDFYYKNGLLNLYHALENNPKFQAVYGKCWTTNSNGKKTIPYLTLPFIPYIFANFCFICQPGTLIRRSAWESVNGLNENLQMAMDYDLWWKLFKKFGKLYYYKQFVSTTRAHSKTKTNNNVDLHYLESIRIIKLYWKVVPLKWKFIFQIRKNISKILK